MYAVPKKINNGYCTKKWMIKRNPLKAMSELVIQSHDKLNWTHQFEETYYYSAIGYM